LEVASTPTGLSVSKSKASLCAIVSDAARKPIAMPFRTLATAPLDRFEPLIQQIPMFSSSKLFPDLYTLMEQQTPQPGFLNIHRTIDH
jgi:hypothetical protein